MSASPGAFEVQVVVDGSTDETIEELQGLVTNYPMEYHLIENLGLTGAMNYGIEKCNGDHIIICDDDIIFHPLYLQNLQKSVMAAPENIHIGNLINLNEEYSQSLIQKVNDGKVLDYDSLPDLESYHTFFDGLKKLYAFKDNYHDFRPSIWWSIVTGNNLCIPKKYFKEVGNFDTGIVGWGPEDADLCYRLFKTGVTASYNEDCHLYHLDHPRNSERIMQTMTKNAVYFVKKHHKPKELYTYLNFTNGKVSLQAFNDECAEIFDLPKVDIPEFYLSTKDYSNKEQILK